MAQQGASSSDGSDAPVQREWVFYTSDTGAETVEKELKKLGRHAKAAVLQSLDRVSRGAQRQNEVKHVRGDIREVRTKHASNEYRVLFADDTDSGESVLLALHAFTKKTQKLRNSDIETAQKRLRAWRERDA